MASAVRSRDPNRPSKTPPGEDRHRKPRKVRFTHRKWVRRVCVRAKASDNSGDSRECGERIPALQTLWRRERDSVTCRDPSASAQPGIAALFESLARTEQSACFSEPEISKPAPAGFSCSGGARSSERTRLSSISRLTAIFAGDRPLLRVDRRVGGARNPVDA
jgi:hypothetical protein